MQYFTVEQIGPKRSRTAHGFMLCHDVPIARTGMQLYGPGETPVALGAADVVRIDRDPEEVFHPDSIASLQGIPIVNEHPQDEHGGRADVTAQNWRDLEIGHVLNPRRGEVPDDDVVIADLLIKDLDAIDLINAGKRELSVGYDAEYHQLAPGHGRQFNIRANHLALVERGRCGPRCSIGDHEFTGLTECQVPRAPGLSHKEARMRRGTTWADKIRAAFRARDADALENVLGQGGEGEEEEPGGNAEHHVHVHLPGAPNGAGEGSGDLVPPSPAPSKPSPTDQPPAAAGAPAPGGGGGGDITQAFQQHVQQNNAEHEELWNAIESLAGAGQGAPAPNGDAFPHRDARRLRDNIGQRDQMEEPPPVEDELGEAPSPTAGGTTVLSGFEMEAPPGTQQNDVRRARDSALFEDSFSETVAFAEIIMPGIRIPTFDRAAPPKKTVDAICELRTRVLDRAWREPDTRELIEQFTGGRFDSARKMTCDSVHVLFRAVGDAKARANKLAMGAAALPFGGGYQTSGGIQTAAQLQAALDAHYAAQRPAR
jgi:uncharacterized protein